MKIYHSSSEKSPARTQNGNNGFSSSLALVVYKQSGKHHSAAEKWEGKKQSLQDTTYLHHSALHGRALAEWLFLTELQCLEKLEKTDRRIRRMERDLKNILGEKDLNKFGCFA